MLSLAVAMGMGRFAFTPLMPMMLGEGSVALPAASWLASANYLGYLVGALLCTLQPWLWSRFERPPAFTYASIVRAGLVTTTLLTVAMALPWPGGWPTLRFSAGVATAVVFVYTSGWCLARLSRLGAPAMGGVIFAGPGVGIVISGLFGSALVALRWTAAVGWLVFGLLALVLTACIWPVLRGGEDRLVASAAAGANRAGRASAAGSASGAARVPGRIDSKRAGDGPGAVGATGEVALLALGYGLAGFGYIITATFLPVIAREALAESIWLDLFWPIFGIGVMAGALLATRLPAGGDRRGRLAIAYIVQALGIATSLWSPTLAGFAIGSLMLGVPFTAITFFAMQEARRLRESAAASYMGLLTATYGLGQIAGPPLVALLLARSVTPGAGFTLSLEIAAAGLLAGALLFLGMIRKWPVSRTGRSGGR